MDFVTITDHDTIDGVLSLGQLPDVFISEELTASFKGESQAVHLLCYGITPGDHEWLQANRDDVEACAAYLQDREITAALAHPFYAVAAPLTARHRRRLAQLFPIWETRNGSRAEELNLPAFVYIETHGGTAIGGSDDHAGIDIGRTFTETPRAANPQEYLAHIRAGRASGHGQQGSAAKWAHAAMALAIRSLGDGDSPERPDPASVLKIGVPTVPAIVDALAEGRYDIVHVCSPGPAGIGAWLVARVLELPRVGSYHTELAAYAALRTGQAELEALGNFGLGMFYGACDVVLSPSRAGDERLNQLGIGDERIRRWDRGVDLNRFDPRHRDDDLLPGEVSILYVGRLSKEKGVDLLADAFLEARRRDPRLHLSLAGGGPEEELLRARLGRHATFLGWLSGEALARAYASADVFLFASSTETFGQVVLEAQASGLPVVAVDRGGPAYLIEHGETGLLAPPDVNALADAVASVTTTPLLSERIGRGALAAVRGRSWEAALDRLAAAYRIALAAHGDQQRARGVA